MDLECACPGGVRSWLARLWNTDRLFMPAKRRRRVLVLLAVSIGGAPEASDILSPITDSADGVNAFVNQRLTNYAPRRPGPDHRRPRPGAQFFCNWVAGEKNLFSGGGLPIWGWGLRWALSMATKNTLFTF